ncbi:MAG TPA: hypothetical protein VHG30_14930 [Microvirga sp.]|jgi:hypothetical protein|nr:hypothetical protein [Microvirga sp.]
MPDKPLDQRSPENKPRPGEKGAGPDATKPENKKDHTEELLDEAVEETFPASDPISVHITR